MLVLALFCASAVAGPGQTQIPSTLADFFLPGSQPNGNVQYEQFVTSNNCRGCHEFQPDFQTPTPIYQQWSGSMMGQAARDPLFYACLAVANQDAAFAGDLCIRCHTPAGWISGRSTPTDGSALTTGDRDGVNCSVCHRMVDPVFKKGSSPSIDALILANIAELPTRPGAGAYILDPEDNRRGPFQDVLPPHPWAYSGFHRDAALCGTCHDVSNPMYERQSDGTYQLDLLGMEHPTRDPYDMFPIERTYSEWLHSDFAGVGVDMGGRFGGNKQVVGTCQDCHMPDTSAAACFYPTAVFRSDQPAHDFAGGNAWVQDMIINLYPLTQFPFDNLSAQFLQDGKARAVSMLQRALTLEATQEGNYLRVHIINETGHKLPSGYPEGRRMWINVQLFDESLTLLREHGHYDGVTADLTTSDTKVYETHLGIDAAVAAQTGIPEGPGFHFALNNVIFKDNRIPPRGFTNAAFAAIQASPIGAKYADGQYSDDTRYRIQRGVLSADVRVFYQTASKDYVTFLRDENVTNLAGQTLYNQWQITGKSPPVQMALANVQVMPFAIGDYDGNSIVNLADYSSFPACLTAPNVTYSDPNCIEFDFDDDGDVDARDFAEFQLNLES